MITKRFVPVSSQIVIISLFIVFFAILFSLMNLIYNDYQSEIMIKKFQEDNQRYQEQNKLKMFEYVRSNLRLVLEKVKKESSNEINPGEQVIVLHTDDTQRSLFETTKASELQQQKPEERYKDLPNIQKWWHFFFD